jgi:hypothetical protein
MGECRPSSMIFHARPRPPVRTALLLQATLERSSQVAAPNYSNPEAPPVAGVRPYLAPASMPCMRS